MQLFFLNISNSKKITKISIDNINIAFNNYKIRFITTFRYEVLVKARALRIGKFQLFASLRFARARLVPAVAHRCPRRQFGALSRIRRKKKQHIFVRYPRPSIIRGPPERSGRVRARLQLRSPRQPSSSSVGLGSRGRR